MPMGVNEGIERLDDAAGLAGGESKIFWPSHFMHINDGELAGEAPHIIVAAEVAGAEGRDLACQEPLHSIVEVVAMAEAGAGRFALQGINIGSRAGRDLDGLLGEIGDAGVFGVVGGANDQATLHSEVGRAPDHAIALAAGHIGDARCRHIHRALADALPQFGKGVKLGLEA